MSGSSRGPRPAPSPLQPGSAAWKTGDRRAFILLGLAVGFSPFFYASGRLVPVLVFLTLLLLRLRPPHRPSMAEIATVALVAMSVCLPLVLFYLRYPDTWSAPLVRVALNFQGPVTPALVAQQAGRTALGMVVMPMIGFYIPGAPMLMPAQALLFLGGLVLCAARWRDPRSAALLLGLAGTIASGALSRDAPTSQRLLFAAPYCAILCAMPLGELGALIRRRFPSFAWHASAAIIVLTLLLAALSVNRLLFWALPRHAYWDAPAEIGTLAGRHLAGLPHPLHGYFLVDEWIARGPRVGHSGVQVGRRSPRGTAGRLSVMRAGTGYRSNSSICSQLRIPSSTSAW